MITINRIVLELRNFLIGGGGVLLLFGIGLKIYNEILSSSSNPSCISLAKGIALVEKEMVIIPSGKFMMRDQANKLQVTFTKPYYMGKYEITQEKWEALMGNNPSDTKGAKLPVTDVSWIDCQEFIKSLNSKTNGGYRLPTEAEWEYACRAGTSTAYSYGDSLTKSDANINGDSLKAAGSYKPNAFGLYDMHGVIPSYPTEDTIPPPDSSTIYTCLYSVYSFVLGLTEDCCGSDLFGWLGGSSTEDNDSKIQRSTCIDVADDDGYDGPGFDVVAAMKKMIPSEKLKKM
jgi:hypothetical protein